MKKVLLLTWLLLAFSCGPQQDLADLVTRATSVSIEDAPGGNGKTISARTLNVWDKITLYAISRDSSGAFVGDINAQWTVTNSLGTLAQLTGTSNILQVSSLGTGVVEATFPTLTTGSTGDLTVVSGETNSLAFIQEPSATSTAVIAFSVQPIVEVRNSSGQRITTGLRSAVPVTVNLTTGTGVLSGTKTVLSQAGVADFSNSGLSINMSGSKRLTAISGVSSAAISSFFTINNGLASKLEFSVLPSPSTKASTPFATQPQVKLFDEQNNLVTTGPDANRSVALLINLGTGTLTGTTSTNAVAGIADFSGAGLKIDLPGNKTLKATSGSLATAETSIFNIFFESGTKLSFRTQPSSTSTAGVAFATQPVVEIQNSSGDLIFSGPDASQTVFLTLSGGTGTLSGTASATAVGGVADFSGKNLSINLSGTNKILRASSGVLTSAFTSTFAIVHAAAVQPALVSNVSDPNTVSSPFATPPTFEVQDIFGNRVTTGPYSSTTFTLTLVGTGVLSGTTSTLAAQGLADFTGANLQVNAVGIDNYLRAAVSGLTATAATNFFDVDPGPAAQISFTTQPSATSISSSPFSTQPVITVQDSLGNTVVSDSSVVTLSIAQGTGTLGGTLSTSAVNGVASFAGAGLNIDLVGTDKILLATRGLLTSTTSTFSITHGAANKLGFVAAIPTTAASVPFATQPQVEIQDAAGNRVTTGSSASATVTLDLFQGNGTLTGTNFMSATTGLADFVGKDLKIDVGGTDKILRAQATSLSAGFSSTFSITAGNPAKLAFIQVPFSTSPHSTPFASPPIVEIQDIFGNRVTTGSSSSLTVDLLLTTGTGVVSGSTSTPASAGLATFSGLSIDTPGTKGFTAASGALTPAVSTPFSVIHGSASQLVWISTPPATSSAGAAFSPMPILELRDSSNFVVTTGTAATSTVSLSLSPSAVTLFGTTSTRMINGQANFTGAGLNIRTAGTGYTLLATTTPSGTGVMSTSSPFIITNTVATQLLFSTQPSLSSKINVAFSTQPAFTVVDQYNNTVTVSTFSTGNVTVTLASGTGTLGGTTFKTSVNGVADFTGQGLSVSIPGTKVLQASMPGLAALTSSSFEITFGDAAKLYFSTHPSDSIAGNALITPPQIQVRDAFDNPVTDSTAMITLSLCSGCTGSLSGTLSTRAVAGLANFSSNSLSINKTGTKFLTAASTGLTSTDSNVFTIGPNAAFRPVFTVAPSSPTVSSTPFTTQPVVEIWDAYDNLVNTQTSTITLSMIGTGTLTGTTSTLAVGGIANFAGSGLKVDLSGTKTMVASGSVLTSTASTSFVINPGAAVGLAFSTQPSAISTAGVAFSRQPSISIVDSFGNLVETDNTSVVSLYLNGGAVGGVLGGGSTSMAVTAGVANFSALRVNLVASTYTLVSSASFASSTVSSDVFSIVPNTASALKFFTQPGINSTVMATAPLDPQPLIGLLDNQGNQVTSGPSHTITLSLNTGSGSLTGTTTKATTSGLANFSGNNLGVTKSGVKTLLASASGLTSTVSGTFNIIHSTASKLIYSQRPSTIANAGVPFPQQPIVEIWDAYDNLVTSGSGSTSAVSFFLVSGTGPLLGTTAFNAVAGVANFSTAGLQLNVTGSNKILLASSGLLTPALSSSFRIIASSTRSLTFTTNPPNPSTAGEVYSSPLLVTIKDNFGNTADEDSTSTVGITLNGTPGVLSGTASVVVSAGVASFGLSIDKIGTYSFTATSTPATTSTTSTTFTIIHNFPSKVVYATQPGATSTAGAALSPQPIVELWDAYDNLVTSHPAVSVLLSVSSGSSTLQGGTTSKFFTSGVADFTGNGLFLNKAGAHTLLATPSSSSISTASSNTITVAHNVATQIRWILMPATSMVNSPLSGSLPLEVLDAFENRVTTGVAASTLFTIFHDSGPGNLTGTTSTNAIAGYVDFNNNGLMLDSIGTHVLRVEVAGLPAAYSSSFAVTAFLTYRDPGEGDSRGGPGIPGQGGEEDGPARRPGGREIFLKKIQVKAFYENYPYWNAFVRDLGRPLSGDTVVPCPPGEFSSRPEELCVHAGEKLRVPIPELKSCRGLKLEDHLKSFRWKCTSEKGYVEFYSVGLKEEKGLKDLLWPTSFKKNFVTIKGKNRVMGKSHPSVWWKNRVRPLPLSLEEDPVYLRGSFNIFTLNQSASSRGHIIADDHISVVTLFDSILQYASSPTSPGPKIEARPSCLLEMRGRNFLWIEGTFDCSSEDQTQRAERAVSATGGGSYSIFRKLTTSGCLQSGITVEGGTHHLFSQIRSQGHQEAGLEILSARYNRFHQIESLKNRTGIRVGGGSFSNIFHQIRTHQNTLAGFILEKDSPGNILTFLFSYSNAGSDSDLFWPQPSPSHQKNIKNLVFLSHDLFGDMVTRRSAASRSPETFFSLQESEDPTCEELDEESDIVKTEISGNCGIREIEDDGQGDDDGLCERGEECYPAPCFRKIIHLKTAMEILFDGTGDDDGLCEAYEKCVHPPSPGPQGENFFINLNDLTRKECRYDPESLPGIRVYYLTGQRKEKEEDSW